MQQSSSWVSVYLPLISTIVVAAATVVLVWLTSRYVRLTGKLVEETRRSREPAVTLDFEMPDNSLRLIVSNRGASPAKNIRISVLKDVSWIEREKRPPGLAEFGPVKEGISYLTPTRTLKYLLGCPRWKGVPAEEMEAILRISYEDHTGKQFCDTVTFDFHQMRGVLFESFKDGSIAVAQAIREAERDRRLHPLSRVMTIPGIGGSRQCPMCGERIPAGAKKCSHCHEMLNA